MRRLGTVLLMSAAVASATALADETRRVKGLDFDHIDVVGSMSVEISQGDVRELTLRGSADDLDREPFAIKGRRLVLGKSSVSGNGFAKVKYRVVVPQLQELHLKGSGDVYVKPMMLGEGLANKEISISVDGSGDIKLYGLRGEDIELRVKGSGDIKAVDVDANRLYAMVAGSGDLYIQTLQASSAEVVVTGSGDVEVTRGGYVQTLEANVIGSGDIDLRPVGVEVAEVNIIGSGTIELGEVTSTIQGAILGSGDVRFDGDPEVDTVELGSGECRRRD